MAIRITRAGVALTVGIIVVSALLIGGFLLARSTAEQARRSEAIKVAQQNLEEASRKQTALNEGNDSQNKDESQSGSSESKPESDMQQNQTQSEQQSAVAPSSPSELPTTGVGDALGMGLGLALLTFAAVAFVQSRRRLLETL